MKKKLLILEFLILAFVLSSCARENCVFAPRYFQRTDGSYLKQPSIYDVWREMYWRSHPPYKRLILNAKEPQFNGASIQ